MYSPEYSRTDSPLSIASVFRRQAAALGLTTSPRQPLAPLARFDYPTPARDRDAQTVAGFVQDIQRSEHPVTDDNECL